MHITPKNQKGPEAGHHKSKCIPAFITYAGTQTSLQTGVNSELDVSMSNGGDQVPCEGGGGAREAGLLPRLSLPSGFQEALAADPPEARAQAHTLCLSPVPSRERMQQAGLGPAQGCGRATRGLFQVAAKGRQWLAQTARGTWRPGGQSPDRKVTADSPYFILLNCDFLFFSSGRCVSQMPLILRQETIQN